MPVALNHQAIKERLLEERAGLQRDIQRLEEIAEQIRSDRAGGEGGVGNHMAEGASNTFDQERNLALVGNLRETLQAVEAALKRLEKGAYGRCETCGQPIDRARLEALPYAAQCVKCQSHLEGR